MGKHGDVKRFFDIENVASSVNGEIGGDVRSEPRLSQHFRVDSRTVKRGDVFVAMRGQNDDGHNYIADAARLGASIVLFERARRDEWFPKAEELGLAAIAVQDPEAAMVALAQKWFAEVSPRVVGITGSVGKTTTREFLYGMLKDSIKVHAAIKSYNTLVGCGMTVLSMPSDTDVLLLELGTNHPGEIRELVANFPVSHGVITEIVPAHIEGLGSLDGILRAKMEIAESKTLRFLSYNNDNGQLVAAVQEWANGLPADREVKKIGVGLAPSDVSIRDVRQCLSADGTPSLSFYIDSQEGEYRCEAKIFGKQHARNIAYAFALATELGVSPEVACEKVTTLATLSGRGKIYSLRGGGLLVDESYNANPGSVSYALKNVLEADVPNGFRRVAILGGMRELGSESAYWHEVVMSRASLFDEVYLIGSEWNLIETQQAALRGRWDTTKFFMNEMDAVAFDGAIILLKGSRYYELEKLIPMLAETR